MEPNLQRAYLQQNLYPLLGGTLIRHEHAIQSHSANGRMVLTCLYCTKAFNGEGINRVKYHVARGQGQVTICKKVPFNDQEEMIKAIK